MTTNHLGFRIVGPCTNERRLVDWQAAFVAYAALDERAEVNREAYLSAFTFADDFRKHLDATGTTKDFDGVCSAEFVWFDIDREHDLELARRDTARLCYVIVERYSLDGDDLLIFFSGSKGFGVGLPTSLWMPSPSAEFHHVARRLAEGLASAAHVVIDPILYVKVQPHRAPNSRHGKTSFHKRHITLDELTGLSLDGIKRLAAKPEAFDVPTITTRSDQATTDWYDAMQAVEREAEAARQRRSTANGLARLNRSTLDFIRDGATKGNRHRLLFSAAANLAEFGCPSALAQELLSEAGLDSGLSPSEVRRQIECGLKHRGGCCDAGA
jgi:hypothetical protein